MGKREKKLAKPEDVMDLGSENLTEEKKSKKKRKAEDMGSDSMKPTKKKIKSKAEKKAAKAKREKTQELYLMDLKQEPEFLSAQKKRIKKRDSCSLFISGTNLPNERVSKLFQQVVSIHRQRDPKNLYVHFVDKTAAKSALKFLEGNAAVLNTGGDDAKFYIVAKENKKVEEPEQILVYQRVLYVSGIPNGTTENDIRALFPNVSKMWPIQKRGDVVKVRNFVFIRFNTSEEAKAAFLGSADFSIRGSALTVLYGKNEDRNSKISIKKREQGKKKAKEGKTKKGKLDAKIKSKQALLKTKIKEGHRSKKKPKALKVAKST